MIGRDYRIVLAGLAGALCLGSGAWAQPEATGPPAVVAAPEPTAESPLETRRNRRTDPNARRCVSTTTVGSRLSRRVCHTNAEWEEIETAARRQAAERGSGGPGYRCDSDPSLCGGMGRTQVDITTGRSAAGGQ